MDGKNIFFYTKIRSLRVYSSEKGFKSQVTEAVTGTLNLFTEMLFLSKIKPKLAHSIHEESRSTMGRLLEGKLKSLSKKVIHKFRLDLNYIFNDKLL